MKEGFWWKTRPSDSLGREKELAEKQSCRIEMESWTKSYPMAKNRVKVRASAAEMEPITSQTRSALGAVLAFSAIRNRCF